MNGILEVVAAEARPAHPLLLIREDCRPQEIAEIIVPGLDSFINKIEEHHVTWVHDATGAHQLSEPSKSMKPPSQIKAKKQGRTFTNSVSFVNRLTVDQPLPSRHAVTRLFMSNSTHSAIVSVFKAGRRSTTPAGPADAGWYDKPGRARIFFVDGGVVVVEIKLVDLAKNILTYGALSEMLPFAYKEKRNQFGLNYGL